MNKLVIANVGKSCQGKSTSLKEVLLNLFENGAKELEGVRIGSFEEDIKTIVTYRGVKIGIESQGDPNSRIFDSLPDFVNKKCDIIICACRTFGHTNKEVKELSNEGYHVLFFSNPRFEENYDPKAFLNFNKEYAKMVKNIIDKRINGEL